MTAQSNRCPGSGKWVATVPSERLQGLARCSNCERLLKARTKWNEEGTRLPKHNDLRTVFSSREKQL